MPITSDFIHCLGYTLHRSDQALLVYHFLMCVLQVYIQTQGASSLSLSISRDDYPEAPLVLRGINSQGALSQQYQPILMMSKSYTLHWDGPAPREIVLSLINFNQ